MRRLIRFLFSKGILVAASSFTVLFVLTLLRAADPAMLTAVRELTFDNYQRLSPRQYTAAPVRIVDIDEKSIEAFGQWPWPRSRMADLTRTLDDMGAAAIVYDILFSEPDRTSPLAIISNLPEETTSMQAIKDQLKSLPDHDVLFAEALAETPSVVGFAMLKEGSSNAPSLKTGIAFAGRNPSDFLPIFPSVLSNLDIFEQAASGSGGISLSQDDQEGIVRRVPMLFSDGTSLYPSLAVEALRVAQGAGTLIVKSTGASGQADTGVSAVTDVKIGAFTVPTTQTGEVWIHFTPHQTDRYVSAKDIFDPSKRQDLIPRIEGQIVFVGTSAAGLLDIRATPLGEMVPGVSIHAQAIEQILSGYYLNRPDWAFGAEVVLTFLIGLVIVLLFPAVGSVGTAVLGGLIAVILIGGSFYLFLSQGLLLDPIYPSLTSLIVFATATALLYIMTDREKRFVRQAFSQYLSPDLVHQLERAPEQLVLGGEMRSMTILFMDVRGFTPISEQLTPTELVTFLNTLLSPLSEIIQTEGGTIDKYIGDSIMAFWNAPVSIDDHAGHACRAALKMIQQVEILNQEDAFGFKAQTFKTQTVQIGIGLNSGDACVGNMGSNRRFNYSVIGDTVNVASRIESSCKAVGADLLVSGNTVEAAPDFAFLEAGEIPLKGKSEPVKLFALVGDESYRESEEFMTLETKHQDLMKQIRLADTTGARETLKLCQHIAPKRLLPFYDTFEDKIRTREKPVK